jgi:hypothetical protein
MSSPISNNLGRTERSSPEPSLFRVGANGDCSTIASRPVKGSGALPIRSPREESKVPAIARLRGLLLSIALASACAVASASNAGAGDLNDYPTSARADYVFACMKANGETQEILQKCSCSIDVIASVIPYDRYVAAETIVSMSQVTGPVGGEFRSTETAKATLEEFHRAQAEAEVRCF